MSCWVSRSRPLMVLGASVPVVGSSWLGFTTEATAQVLHIVVNCTGNGSLACNNATSTTSRRFRVAF